MLRKFAVGLIALPVSLGALSVGDTRQEVLAELGEPKATLAAGNREFFTYDAGRIEFTDGKVTAFRGDFSAQKATPKATAPAAAPGGSKDPAVMASPYQGGHWFTDFHEALEEAENTDKRVLALFTGSDWCPPCQRFETEVAHDEDFAKVFSPYFVFVKVDWLRNTPQPAAASAEVDRLRNEYDIEYYPTLKILDSQGEELDEVDWTGERGNSFKGIMMKAIDDSRIATAGGQKAKSSWWPF